MNANTKRNLAIGGAIAGAGLLAYAFLPPIFLDPRQRFLKAAAEELGKTDWEQYLHGVTLQTPGSKIHWCGVFALWSAHKAGFACDWMWDLSTGKGFLYRLPVTKDPKPGDMGYLHNFQHHAIIEKVDGNMITTLDGNSGPAPSRVLRNVRPRSSFATFYDTSPMWQMKC